MMTDEQQKKFDSFLSDRKVVKISKEQIIQALRDVPEIAALLADTDEEKYKRHLELRKENRGKLDLATAAFMDHQKTEPGVIEQEKLAKRMKLELEQIARKARDSRLGWMEKMVMLRKAKNDLENWMKEKIKNKQMKEILEGAKKLRTAIKQTPAKKLANVRSRERDIQGIAGNSVLLYTQTNHKELERLAGKIGAFLDRLSEITLEPDWEKKALDVLSAELEAIRLEYKAELNREGLNESEKQELEEQRVKWSDALPGEPKSGTNYTQDEAHKLLELVEFKGLTKI